MPGLFLEKDQIKNDLSFVKKLISKIENDLIKLLEKKEENQ